VGIDLQACIDVSLKITGPPVLRRSSHGSDLGSGLLTLEFTLKFSGV